MANIAPVAAIYALTILVLIRFGILPMALAIFVSSLLTEAPITTDLSAWYAAPTIVSVCITTALLAWSFYTALAGRSVFGAGFLDD